MATDSKTLPLLPIPWGKRVDRDFDEDKGHVDRCFFCERPLTAKGIGCWVEVTDGPTHIIPVGRTAEDFGDTSQGCFPLGSTCKKKVPKEYRLPPGALNPGD